MASVLYRNRITDIVAACTLTLGVDLSIVGARGSLKVLGIPSPVDCRSKFVGRRSLQILASFTSQSNGTLLISQLFAPGTICVVIFVGQALSLGCRGKFAHSSQQIFVSFTSKCDMVKSRTTLMLAQVRTRTSYWRRGSRTSTSTSAGPLTDGPCTKLPTL